MKLHQASKMYGDHSKLLRRKTSLSIKMNPTHLAWNRQRQLNFYSQNCRRFLKYSMCTLHLTKHLYWKQWKLFYTVFRKIQSISNLLPIYAESISFLRLYWRLKIISSNNWRGRSLSLQTSNKDTQATRNCYRRHI